MIVHKSDAVTLIGGADVSKSQLDRSLTLAPFLVAADGGADAALRYGHAPGAVIGDFDSVSDAARERLPMDVLHPIEEQDSTDFDKCMRNISAPLIVGVGFHGERLDHQLAGFNTLVCHPERRCILLGSEEIVFLAPPALDLDLPTGTRFSLFPFGEVSGVSSGLSWPIEGLQFAPDGRIGTSNITTGPVRVEFGVPKMLIILPEAHLETVAEALLACPAHWPAAS